MIYRYLAYICRVGGEVETVLYAGGGDRVELILYVGVVVKLNLLLCFKKFKFSKYKHYFGFTHHPCINNLVNFNIHVRGRRHSTAVIAAQRHFFSDK